MYKQPSDLRKGLCVVAVLLSAACVMTAGCGRGDRSPVAPVSGKVLFNGKPLQFGMVMFVPDTGRPAQGSIRPDGTFTLSTYQENDGAVVGRHRVEITCTRQPKDEGGEPAPGPSLIPAKYTEYRSSGLEADVKSEGNAPFIFELIGKAP